MTDPSTSQGQQAADRREAQIRLLEAAIAAAVLSDLRVRLGLVTNRLRVAFARRDADLSVWVAARQAAAGDLWSIRSTVAESTTRMLPRAVMVGVRQAAEQLPAGVTVDAPVLTAGYDALSDDLTARTLEQVDTLVTQRLMVAAGRILSDPITTPAELDTVTARVDAAVTQAQASTGTAVVRAVAGGVAAVAEVTGTDRVWWAEPSACLSCASMSGSVAKPGGLFYPVTVLTDRLIPWLADGITGPEAHGSCRCHTALATAGLPDALAREAERAVAKGESAYDSLPARLRAVSLLLRSGHRLPKSVRARAATDRARGAFSVRRPSRVPVSTRSGRDG